MNMFALKGKNVLVTGAGGFIGSKLCEMLIEGEAKVHGFFHYSGKHDTGLIHAGALSCMTLHFGNLADTDSVEKAVKDSNADIVIHLGASISIPYSYQNPRDVMLANVVGTLNILQACQKQKVSRLVVTSSSEVYGSADIIPITEENPFKPQSPYSASKVSGDAIARSFYCSFDLPVVILRPFNTFGPRQSDRAVIPNVIKQALWSDTIQVGALHTKRDFVFVDDTARAFMLAADPENYVINGESIHFGTNEAYSVQEMIDKVQAIVGTNKAVVVSEFRKRPNMSEVLHLQADYSKAKRLLGWEPTVTFESGLDQVVEYMKTKKEEFEPTAYRV